MLKFIDEIRAGKALLRLIRDPNRTEEIFKIAEIGLSRGEELTQAVVDRAMAEPGFRALYERRYCAPKVSLDRLAQLGPDTLGRVYAKHMRDNGLEPEFFPRFEMDDPIRYLSIRARESHDIWHVLAGYDTSVKGELALQGFTLAQTQSALPGILLAAGLLHVAKGEPVRVPEFFEAMSEGYARGMKARHLLSIAFEELWDQPLEQVRERAGIPPLAVSARAAAPTASESTGHTTRRDHVAS